MAETASLGDDVLAADVQVPVAEPHRIAEEEELRCQAPRKQDTAIGDHVLKPEMAQSHLNYLKIRGHICSTSMTHSWMPP